MKTIPALVICSFFTFQGIAQQKVAPKAHPVKSPLSAEKTQMLCKPWKLDTIEQFGLAEAVNAKEQNDGMTFLADSTFFITREGVPGTGKWKPTWGNSVSVSFGNPATTMLFKIVSITDGKMVMTYQTPDLITYKYTYSAKPKKQ